MSLIEVILLFGAVLPPLLGYLFLRRMRAIQREEIEARHDRLYREALELIEPKDREQFSRAEADAASDRNPE